MTKNILKIVLNLIIFITFSIIVLIIPNNNISHLIRIVILIGGVLLYSLSFILKLRKLNKLSRFFYVCFLILALIILGFYILCITNFLEIFTSVSSFKAYILSSREKGVIIYILIQALQVIILPVPAAIICLAGSLIYGPLLGGIYCSVGVLIGSIISFVIGKTFGHRIVEWIVGIDNCNKYSEIIRKRGGFFLVLAFLLPMFPDDILCLIAGITNMTFRTFLLITIITRPIGVICMSYFGSGYIIPFTGWGLYAWVGILIVAIIMIVITYKYQDQMQTYIMKKVFRKKD